MSVTNCHSINAMSLLISLINERSLVQLIINVFMARAAPILIKVIVIKRTLSIIVSRMHSVGTTTLSVHLSARPRSLLRTAHLRIRGWNRGFRSEVFVFIVIMIRYYWHLVALSYVYDLTYFSPISPAMLTFKNSNNNAADFYCLIKSHFSHIYPTLTLLRLGHHALETVWLELERMYPMLVVEYSLL